MTKLYFFANNIQGDTISGTFAVVGKPTFAIFQVAEAIPNEYRKIFLQRLAQEFHTEIYFKEEMEIEIEREIESRKERSKT